ncbi:hypothetical protein GGX14DRAFT_392928 [Mycena pura]|uniref:Uncharacterized protein n=1 Tax=Mycena pura TaxID=153505 RepID=A0AAD6YDG9_9AGAR|nr:hypothetical protein GGX14DRAFT_392928 [Mycena pura]
MALYRELVHREGEGEAAGPEPGAVTIAQNDRFDSRFESRFGSRFGGREKSRCSSDTTRWAHWHAGTGRNPAAVLPVELTLDSLCGAGGAAALAARSPGPGRPRLQLCADDTWPWKLTTPSHSDCSRFELSGLWFSDCWSRCENDSKRQSLRQVVLMAKTTPRSDCRFGYRDRT